MYMIVSYKVHAERGMPYNSLVFLIRAIFHSGSVRLGIYSYAAIGIQSTNQDPRCKFVVSLLSDLTTMAKFNVPLLSPLFIHRKPHSSGFQETNHHRQFDLFATAIDFFQYDSSKPAVLCLQTTAVNPVRRSPGASFCCYSIGVSSITFAEA